MSNEISLSGKTLVPISVIGGFFGFGFYVSSLVKDIESLAKENRALASNDAEIIQEQKSISITINQIEKMLVLQNADIKRILKKMDE